MYCLSGFIYIYTHFLFIVLAGADGRRSHCNSVLLPRRLVVQSQPRRGVTGRRKPCVFCRHLLSHQNPSPYWQSCPQLDVIFALFTWRVLQPERERGAMLHIYISPFLSVHFLPHLQSFAVYFPVQSWIVFVRTGRSESKWFKRQSGERI